MPQEKWNRAKRRAKFNEDLLQSCQKAQATADSSVGSNAVSLGLVCDLIGSVGVQQQMFKVFQQRQEVAANWNS